MATNLKLRVDRIEQQSEDIRSFRLVDPLGGKVPAFTPGSHLDVSTPMGPVRPYSLCSDPSDLSGYTIAVKLELASRGGSIAMHDRLAEGDILTVGMPRNHFQLAEDNGRSLLLAGGVGITPLLAMGYELRSRGRPFDLHYFVRSDAHLSFREILLQAPFCENTTVHYGLSPECVVQTLDDLACALSDDDHVYVCGPLPFMKSAEVVIAPRVVQGAFHTEYFSAGEAKSSSADDRPFEVVLIRSGLTCSVAAKSSIAQALIAAGVDVTLSCEQGICGTCLTKVIEGTPDHRDSYLMDEEKSLNDSMCICVSRAKSDRLILDL